MLSSRFRARARRGGVGCCIHHDVVDVGAAISLGRNEQQSQAPEALVGQLLQKNLKGISTGTVNAGCFARRDLARSRHFNEATESSAIARGVVRNRVHGGSRGLDPLIGIGTVQNNSA